MSKTLPLLSLICGLAYGAVAVAADAPKPPHQVEVLFEYPELVPDMLTDKLERVPAENAPTRGGILDQVIQDAVNKGYARRGDERLAPLRALIPTYEFDKKFERVLRAKLAAAQLAGPAQFDWVPAERVADRDLVAAGVRTDLLVLSPRASILVDFEDLAVVVDARRLDRKPKGDKVKQKVHDFRQYAYHFVLRKQSGTRAAAEAQRWVALGGERLAAMLDRGIEEVTDMIVNDLSAAGFAEASQPVKLSERKSLFLAGADRFGRLVEPGPDRVWLRKKDRLEGFQEVNETASDAAATPH